MINQSVGPFSNLVYAKALVNQTFENKFLIENCAFNMLEFETSYFLNFF